MSKSATPTVRAAIYARFSSDLQDGRSIDDQVAICREYAARHGWQIAHTYADHAISGASIHGRAEFQRMLADVEERGFDVVVAEDVDRYARNAADAIRFQQLAEFAGVRVFTVADGEANELIFGFKGIMAASWLKGHALKVRRGMEGRIRAGLSAGGRCYGYAGVPGKPGVRVIIETEAAIVRRIFAEYVAGRTPREIAHGLNRDRVPAPRGARWNASTLKGNTARGYGLLTNPIYSGVTRFNRVRMVKDPATGKRISRVNPAEAIRDAATPELAIVPADVFAAAAVRLARRSHAPHGERRRPRYLFSGLLRCAACGGGLSAAGVDKSQRRRLRCSTDKESGTCPAPATFYLDVIERRVLDRLRDELREPDVLAAYVKEYHAERQRLAADAGKKRATMERRLASVLRELDRAVRELVSHDGDMTAVRALTRTLGAERDDLERRLAALDPAPHAAVALHPQAIARFKAHVARLRDAIAEDMAGGQTDAAEAIRELVERVTVRRDTTQPDGLSIEITGRLEVMLGATRPPVWGKAVAGVRYNPSPHPIRFRLAA
jgi:site-specific DNA recombinase